LIARDVVAATAAGVAANVADQALSGRQVLGVLATITLSDETRRIGGDDTGDRLGQYFIRLFLFACRLRWLQRSAGAGTTGRALHNTGAAPRGPAAEPLPAAAYAERPAPDTVGRRTSSCGWKT
jgi:hypothetical protein